MQGSGNRVEVSCCLVCYILARKSGSRVQVKDPAPIRAVAHPTSTGTDLAFGRPTIHLHRHRDYLHCLLTLQSTPMSFVGRGPTPIGWRVNTTMRHPQAAPKALHPKRWPVVMGGGGRRTQWSVSSKTSSLEYQWADPLRSSSLP